jgi:hypothetical protein
MIVVKLLIVGILSMLCSSLYVEQLLGPASPADREVWFANITDWRDQQVSYDRF